MKQLQVAVIDSPSNARVKELQALALPKGRKEQGRFLVEGVRLVSDALRGGWKPESALLNSDLLSRTGEGRQLLHRLDALRAQEKYHQELNYASARALASVSETRHPQGIVASFKLPDWELPGAIEWPLLLICDDVQDPGNLGTILRSAEAAGVQAVLLTTNCVDIFNPKVVRAGMGAHFRLPAFRDMSWERIDATVAGAGLLPERVFAADPGGVLDYNHVDWKQGSALIVSNEAHGLSERARQTALGGLLSIPMLGGTESLNSAMAATVILFETARQRRVTDSVK
ncbi:MAG: RNA methyltransferase [Chloroflexota bacterium]